MQTSKNQSQPSAAKQRPRLNRKDLEFLAPALAIIETPASPLRWVGGWFIVNSFLLAFLWAAWSEVDIIATGHGRVVPQGHAQTVQAVEPGRVLRLNVREGAIVRRGDVLVELDPTDVRADIDRWQREVVASQRDIVRLERLVEAPAERGAVLLVEFADDPSLRARYNAELAEQTAKLAAIAHQIEEQRLNRRTAEAAVKQAAELLPLMNTRVVALAALSRKQMVPLTQMNDAKQRALEASFQMASNKDKIEQADANILRLQQNLEQVANEFEAKNLHQLSVAHSRMSEARQQLVKAQVRLEGMALRAPADGVVFGMTVNTVGGHVGAGQLVMAVVPADEPMQVEAMVAPKDIGFVEAGQPAEIKIDAFPFTRYGLMKGTVVRISRDASHGIDLTPAERQSGQAGAQGRDPAAAGRSFLVTVAIDPRDTGGNYSKLPLSPGMSATVEITTGKRTLLDFVLSPIKEGLHGAARER